MRDSGVEPELTELCRHEHARLVGLLALYVGDRAIAEELAQEALVRLHQHWPRVRSLASPHAWVSTVALNLARSDDPMSPTSTGRSIEDAWVFDLAGRQ